MFLSMLQASTRNNAQGRADEFRGMEMMQLFNEMVGKELSNPPKLSYKNQM